jgi:hypothetical protein
MERDSKTYLERHLCRPLGSGELAMPLAIEDPRFSAVKA